MHPQAYAHQKAAAKATQSLEEATEVHSKSVEDLKTATDALHSKDTALSTVTADLISARQHLQVISQVQGLCNPRAILEQPCRKKKPTCVDKIHLPTLVRYDPSLQCACAAIGCSSERSGGCQYHLAGDRQNPQS